MRLNVCLVAIMGLLFSVPAMAGTVSANGGQVSWVSTQCTAPPDGPAPIATRPNLHATADDANRRVVAYNDYTQKVQTYVDCIGNEAQADAKSLGDSIIASAQKTVDEARKTAADADPSQKHH